MEYLKVFKFYPDLSDKATIAVTVDAHYKLRSSIHVLGPSQNGNRLVESLMRTSVSGVQVNRDRLT
jgi:hypothetical protein